MKKTILTFAIAISALTPAALLAQTSAPSISEIVVTKNLDSTSMSVNRPANAELIMEFLDDDKPVALRAHVDAALLREIQAAARGTGKTLSAEVLAHDHFKSIKLSVRKGGTPAAQINRAANENRAIRSLILIVPVYGRSSDSQPYLQMKLSRVFVTSYSTSSAGGTAATDSFSIKYSAIKFEYKPQK